MEGALLFILKQVQNVLFWANEYDDMFIIELIKRGIIYVGNMF